MSPAPSNLPPLLLAADDFTGAADVAAGACAQWRTTLRDWLYEGERPALPGRGEALSINTASRHLSPDQAVERLRSLLDQLSDDAWFYKKCDSTMRGNIGAEIAAVCERFPHRQLVYVGAAPEAGRTVRGGRVFLHGVPVTETDFARDPLFPVRTSSITELLEAEGLDTAIWEGSSEPWPKAQVIIPDSRDAKDLRVLALQIAELPHGPVFAGAGSMVRFLALATRGTSFTPGASVELQQPDLIANGSLHPISLKQIDNLAKRGCPVVALPPECFFGPDPEKHLAATRARAIDHPLQGTLMIRTVVDSDDAADYYDHARQAGYSRDEVEECITSTLAGFVASVFPMDRDATLLSIGGELTTALWRKLGIRGAKVHGFAHGCMPVMRVRTTTGHAITWATKPGGYGEPDLLEQLLR